MLMYNTVVINKGFGDREILGIRIGIEWGRDDETSLNSSKQKETYTMPSFRAISRAAFTSA